MTGHRESDEFGEFLLLLRRALLGFGPLIRWIERRQGLSGVRREDLTKMPKRD